MIGFTPSDQAERDAITTHVAANMIVEAGAGTGKTTVLVERIVRIIASGQAPVHELAVITFTEKAAAELSARVRQGLEDALAASALDDERARIEVAIRGLNHAHIETIHAFASGLLRERPVEAGLDPGFEVLDSLPAQLEFDAAWSEWLTEQTSGDTPPEALINALNLQLDVRLVREAAQELNRHRDLLRLAPYAKRAVDPVAALDALYAQIEVLRGLKQYCVDQTDKGYLQIDVLDERIADIASLRGHEDSLKRAIVSMDRVKWNDGNQQNWADKRYCIAMKDAYKTINSIVDDTRRHLREAAVADMLQWLQDFVFFYDQRRKGAGKADFDDLLVWARDLIRRDADVRAYFQQKYRCILVDEFQDTDPLQVELIVSLCAQEPLPPKWRETTLRPGSLFVVGDPKQSIYRFRRADIAMYDDVKRDIFGGQTMRITQNFRSVDGVIGWVNDTFSSLFDEKDGVQPPYVALTHHPDYVGADATTLIGGDAVAGGGYTTRAQSARWTEAEAIASLILRQISDGGWLVREGKAAEPKRPARYGDVVILIPSRTDLVIYEDALARAGVPYRHEGGRTFFLRQEVRELVAVLRAIDDPADGVAAVAALRSAAFGCSDEDLLLHKTNGGRFDFMTLKPDAAGPAAGSLAKLRNLAAMRYTKTLPDLIRAVLDETRLVEFAMLQPQGEQVAANLLKVIDQARSFAEASGGGLRGFVRWLKEHMSRQADETDATISEETDDVVRIITVHAAKGLEFPVVIFANMGTRRYDYTRVIADRGSNVLHMRLGKRGNYFQTPEFDVAEAAEKAHSSAEELRLLYVAATRAKDRLVVPFVDSKAAKAPAEPECLNDWLKKGNGNFGVALDITTLPPIQASLPVWKRTPAPMAVDVAQRIVGERKRWLDDHSALVERARRPLVVRTASALKPEWDRPLASTDDVRRGGATEFGSAVHALIERIDLQATDELDEVARAVANEYGMPQRAGEIAKIGRRALESEVVRRAVDAPRRLLEAPFAVALPVEAGAASASEGLAEGRIDLLFEEDGQIVIVDFKTDAVSAADVEARSEHYRNQALVYAWAVHHATRMPVREVVFLYARLPAEHSYAVDAAFLAEAEALMRTAPVALEVTAPGT